MVSESLNSQKKKKNEDMTYGLLYDGSFSWSAGSYFPVAGHQLGSKINCKRPKYDCKI